MRPHGGDVRPRGEHCGAHGQVAALAGVIVRTLHHDDEIALLSPGGRSSAGYRMDDEADLVRLHRALAYRQLGFPLDQVASILDDPQADTSSQLRREHRLVRERIERLQEVPRHIDKEMEADRMGTSLTPEEQFEVFGENWLGDEYAAEAEQVEGGLAAALAAGVPASATGPMDRAERHRQHIHTRFYDCSPDMHRGLGDMYVGDPRFMAHYDGRARARGVRA